MPIGTPSNAHNGQGGNDTRRQGTHACWAYTDSMQRLFPDARSDLTVEDAYKDLSFPEPPPARPYVILNFVLTVDGQATVGTTGVAGIGSDIDRRLMHELRVAADGLLHGAETVRRDSFPPAVRAHLVPARLARGLSAQPLGAVITRSGNLDPANRYFAGRPPVVFTTQAMQPDLARRLHGRAEVLAAGERDADLPVALAMLRKDFAIGLLLCEGGSTLAYQLLSSGCLDEIFLTIAPKVGSDRAALRLFEGAAFAADSLPRLELCHVLSHESELFLRYRVL